MSNYGIQRNTFILSKNLPFIEKPLSQKNREDLIQTPSLLELKEKILKLIKNKNDYQKKETIINYKIEEANITYFKNQLLDVISNKKTLHIRNNPDDISENTLLCESSDTTLSTAEFFRQLIQDKLQLKNKVQLQKIQSYLEEKKDPTDAENTFLQEIKKFFNQYQKTSPISIIAWAFEPTENAEPDFIEKKIQELESYIRDCLDQNKIIKINHSGYEEHKGYFLFLSATQHKYKAWNIDTIFHTTLTRFSMAEIIQIWSNIKIRTVTTNPQMTKNPFLLFLEKNFLEQAKKTCPAFFFLQDKLITLATQIELLQRHLKKCLKDNLALSFSGEMSTPIIEATLQHFSDEDLENLLAILHNNSHQNLSQIREILDHKMPEKSSPYRVAYGRTQTFPSLL